MQRNKESIMKERNKCEKDLEKEGKRQKRYYQKTENLSKNELKARHEVVRGRVKKQRNSVQKVIDSSIDTASTVSVESLSAVVGNMKFLKRREFSRKRKRQRNDRISKKNSKARRRNK